MPNENETTEQFVARRMDEFDFIVELADVEIAPLDKSNFAPSNERELWRIAQDIIDNWPKVNYAAKPYLEAMSGMRSIDDMYGLEDGVMIVLYFLSNASGWRGEAAKRIKAELNAQVAAHNNRKGRSR